MGEKHTVAYGGVIAQKITTSLTVLCTNFSCKCLEGREKAWSIIWILDFKTTSAIVSCAFEVCQAKDRLKASPVPTQRSSQIRTSVSALQVVEALVKVVLCSTRSSHYQHVAALIP